MSTKAVLRLKCLKPGLKLFTYVYTTKATSSPSTDDKKSHFSSLISRSRVHAIGFHVQIMKQSKRRLKVEKPLCSATKRRKNTDKLLRRLKYFDVDDLLSKPRFVELKFL